MQKNRLQYKDQPIVGVLITNVLIRKLKNRNCYFKSYERMFELAKAAKDLSTNLYFFSCKNVDLENNQVKGTYLNTKNNTWNQKYFPLPDVLYDRIGAITENVNQIRVAFEKMGIKKINSSCYFNKWDVFNELNNNQQVKKYLPNTELFQDMDQLRSFVDSYPVVYLKGVKSGRGRGVIRVEQKSEHSYIYSYCKDEIISGEFKKLEDFIPVIDEFYKGKQFIIQEGIQLIKYGERNVDFRAEVQRNGDGKLDIVGISARIAAKQSPITIDSHAVKFDDFFMDYLDYTFFATHIIKYRAMKFIHTVYEAIESIYGPFGEIGIDFGIDTNGKILFIEPNSKTAKVSLKKAYNQNVFKQSLYNPLAYAKHLLYKQDDV